MRPIQKIAEFINVSGKTSHSYQGEDILLWRYFKERNIHNGFFIDVGAYHPKFFNNTWRLRKKLGFKGINIEPSNNIKLFKRFRCNDINLQCLVGDYNGMAMFNYITAEPAISGKDKSKLVLKPDKEIKIKQLTLTEIISRYKVKKIDLLDVDVEGTEMEIIRDGYDWSVKPRLILIEDDKDKDSKILSFLTDKGYKQIAHTLNNALYEHEKLMDINYN